MREHLAAASAAAAASAGLVEQQQEGGSCGAGSLAGQAAPAAPAPACSAAVARQRLGERQAEQQQMSFVGCVGWQGLGEASLQAHVPSTCSPLSSASRHLIPLPQALLLRWVEDQEGGAFEALEKAKAQLLSLKVCRAAGIHQLCFCIASHHMRFAR